MDFKRFQYTATGIKRDDDWLIIAKIGTTFWCLVRYLVPDIKSYGCIVYKLVVIQPWGGLEVPTELSDTSNDGYIMYIKDDLAEHKIGCHHVRFMNFC